jgi:hypothetical protein
MPKKVEASTAALLDRQWRACAELLPSAFAEAPDPVKELLRKIVDTCENLLNRELTLNPLNESGGANKLNHQRSQGISIGGFREQASTLSGTVNVDVHPEDVRDTDQAHALSTAAQDGNPAAQVNGSPNTSVVDRKPWPETALLLKVKDRLVAFAATLNTSDLNTKSDIKKLCILFLLFDHTSKFTCIGPTALRDRLYAEFKINIRTNVLTATVNKWADKSFALVKIEGRGEYAPGPEGGKEFARLIKKHIGKDV